MAKAKTVVPLRVVSTDPKKGGKGPGGRPPHQPTLQTRKLVELAKGIGYTDEQIARSVGIAVKTLTIHYAEELSAGGEKINLAIAGNLASIASSSTHPRAVTAAIYWTKARMGWADAHEEDDSDEAPMEFSIRIGEKRDAAS
ncbi:hypothetical protein UFOVP32_67 [uncultured Caudovirales phage]|uniref:Uncharacterized protein n=1 Tax=uncultured Caudovirales phage TaxID=2100421 RepID=A0A6J5KRP2_9CAUD|nr:hypothetical protein UFOVP32_67 [uncultured Caudovirales phage]CAB4123547.1 hypothetical protein UFOVP50_9 [uncultured Caudovirales phage]